MRKMLPVISMNQIQALNRPKNQHQKAHRITVWAGRETSPGVRGEWVVYGTSVPAAIGRAVRFFRRNAGKNGRFSDWTVNVEPLRADETITR